MGDNAKTSDLTAASALTGDELIYVVQGGNSRQASLNTIGAWVDGSVNVKWYGVTGDGVTDDLAAINTAVASGLPLVWPPGTYRVTSTVTCTTAQTWTALGTVSIVYDAAAGSAVAPVLDFKEKVDITGDFDIDHQADTKGFIPPTVYGGNVITGSAVLIQGDYSSVSEVTVRNSWDNGIAVIKLSALGVETAGSPKYWSITGTETVGCGTGEHAGLTPGKIGAGIDVGSGSAGTVSDCVDFNSYLGFIIDLGAGAQAEFVNCVSWYAKNDAANPTNGSGYGFYIGSGDSRITNCTAVGSEYRGFWYDGVAQNCDFVNCMAYVCEREGFWVKGGDASFIGCRAKGCGTDTTNTYPAFWIDSSAGAIPSLSFIGCTTTGSDHKYGILFSGANTIDFKQVGGDFTGATSRYSGLDSYTTSQWVSRDGRWGNVDDPTLDVELMGTTSDWTATVVGDSSNNGGFVISDKANRNNRIAMGYDPTNNVGVIQAITAGTSKRQLLLNPSGGDVGLGAGSWTTGHSTMGSYHFWVDSDGRLRSKSSAPSSDTDGLAVGGARYTMTINDDAVSTIDFGATVTALIFRFADNQGNGGNFAVRAASSPLIRAMGVTSGGATIASVNTALTGTTGTDGNITIGCDNTGKVYVENRSGSQRSFIAWVER